MLSGQAKKVGRGGRFYSWGSEHYWSVTTILGALSKPALQYWAAKSVAEVAFDQRQAWMNLPDREGAIEYLARAPQRYTGQRAGFGTRVHDLLESKMLGKRFDASALSIDEQAALSHFTDFCITTGAVHVASECPVYSRKWAYAGTLDAIWEFPAELLDRYRLPWTPRPGRDTVTILGDYKTGKKVWPEADLQINAYGRADFAGLPDGREHPLPVFDGAAILHVNEAGWQLIPCRFDEEIFRFFLHIREAYRFRAEVEKEVFGTPIGPRGGSGDIRGAA